MPELFDITKWNPQLWYNTGGTRSKKYVQNPDNGKYYYFKRSYKTDGRDYFFEFWSEIVATNIGTMLGFDVLKYDLAIDNLEMGCISESMITQDETLTEGGKYLRAQEINFDPRVKDARKLHSFQLIVETLDAFYLSEHIGKIVEIIIFDSIIGNGDRHQENWAFINKPSFAGIGLQAMEDETKKGTFDKASRLLKNFLKSLIDFKKKEIKSEVKAAALLMEKTKSFAPIFDNGSSLGRELEVEKINRMLNNQQELMAYINRGLSEIHWENEKLNHFELIKRLLESSYMEVTKNIINRVVNLFNKNKGDMNDMIFSIDNSVPDNLHRYKLPDIRKELILKLITLRIDKLASVIV